MNKRRILTLSIATLSSFSVSAHGATWFWDRNDSIINSASDNSSTSAMNWLNGGRFRIVDAATVSGTLTANAGGSIEVENSAAQTWTKAVAGAGTFVKGGAGALTVGSGLLNVTGVASAAA